ncbi:MAG: glycine zipper 2TM domain-containing protein [SAR116 cluster bacterium]|nr:hypothetical protein [Paracoccaceae bacterium]RCL77996.1 MAG: glycine zipper 2TM domain-containing protein [SAR116 cluster bacterium]RPH14277.1 MAG: glycine zipper 2TM domain-containing protein [Alphaproteobacteria bacterium TMED150]|tara:strand:- start:994 stop:1482 length:489 start_codon:yes stop_codon:yes gene_type:complete
MNNIKKMAVILALTTGLAACQTTGTAGNSQTTGAVVGGLAGGLLGAQVGQGSGRVAAAAVGAALGALAGSAIGKSLDDRSQQLAGNAVKTSHTAPIGQQISWSNPQNANGAAQGYVVPIRDGRDSAGNYCREYQNTIIVGGKKQSAYGTACRQPDGSWKIVS